MLKYIFIFLTFISSCLFATSDILQTYEPYFSRLPDWNANTAKIYSFGKGCTNQNYKLEVGGSSYFVRLHSPAKSTLGLSFAKEIELIELASSLEISPQMLVADAEQGIIIFRFIEGKTVDLRNKDKLNEAMRLIKKFHDCGKTLSFQAAPEDFISDYLEIIQDLNIELTPFQKGLIAMRPQLTISHLVPCHLDIKGDNILDDGNRLWLIDWEYGGMSDPLLDIAQLAPSEHFSNEEIMLALSYYDPDATPEMKQKLEELCILSNMRVALWCVIMSHISTLDRPYEKRADQLFREIEKALISKKCKTGSQTTLEGLFVYLTAFSGCTAKAVDDVRNPRDRH